MNILISAVGTTDPISHNRDAALLHIARTYRPEKIVLVYSEEMLIKQDLIEKAIFSIEDYHPEVMIESTILKNDEVYLFDKMYEVMGQIVEKYSGTNHQLILNLSSGTPQIISALFALNRIKDYNTQAIQVATPNKSANRQYVPLSSEGEQKLFNENEDNQKDYEDRTIKDEAEKFNQSLIKRHLRNLIASYDYLAAEELVTKKEYNNLLSKKKLSFLRATLNDFVKVFKTQAILKDIQDYPLTDVEKKALNYFLMIEVLKERGQVADVLIKSKSYVEFIIEEKIKKDYPDLIKYDGALPKLNEEYKDFEEILDFIDLEFKKLNVFIGPQASGKSITIKLAYFFKEMFSDLFPLYFLMGHYLLHRLRRYFLCVVPLVCHRRKHWLQSCFQSCGSLYLPNLSLQHCRQQPATCYD